MALINAPAKTKQNYFDLKITPSDSSGLKQLSGDFRHCIVTKSKDGHKYISLRLPQAVQDSILSAYQDGKTVRIFG